MFFHFFPERITEIRLKLFSCEALPIPQSGFQSPDHSIYGDIKVYFPIVAFNAVVYLCDHKKVSTYKKCLVSVAMPK